MNEYLKDDDVELLLRFKYGDISSYEELLDKYQSPIINFLYRITGDKTEAEDLAQEVFLKVYNSRVKYTPRAKFSTWIYTIAKNTALNEIRRKKGIFHLFKKDLNKEGAEEEIPDNRNPSVLNELEKKDVEKIVKNEINSLPQNQKITVILSKYDNLSYEEIAQVMNCSVSSVKSLLNRAKISLKGKLKKYICD